MLTSVLQPARPEAKLQSHGMAYRRDIDGLRALAVVPVVIFHIAQSFIPGGYVGVDIFFVISGYLISGNILRDLAENRFSLARFYEHRLRRIFPAYAVVLAFVTVIEIMRFLPPQARDYGKALLAAVGSVTNIWFMATTGYFALAAEELPLLHTWSLAVEEQFYLVFPLTVLLVATWPKSWVMIVAAATFVASLGLSAVGAYAFPTGTFYLLPTRAWELLLGTIVASNVVPMLRSSHQRNGMAAVGLLLIAMPMLLYNSYTVFPGLAAVPPCLGAAFIIHAGKSGSSLVGTVLSLRPVVFIGLISYSLYLWHWPLLALQRTDLLLVHSDSKLVVKATVFIVSFLCAAASWGLIERPTRNRRLVSGRALVTTSAAAALGLVAIASVLIVTHGLPGRFSPESRAVADYLDYDPKPQFREGRCFLDEGESFSHFDQSACLPNQPDRSNVIIMGDSHAAALTVGLSEAFPAANILQVTGVGCAPLSGGQNLRHTTCPSLVRLALDELPRLRKIAKVWLVSRWRTGAAGLTPTRPVGWLPDLLQTARNLRAQGIEATILGPMPEYDLPLPVLLARAIETHDPALPHRMMSPEPLELDKIMSATATKEGIPYVSLVDLLCPEGRCIEYAAPGIPLLFDSSHLTAAGSVLVARSIAKLPSQ